MLNQMLLTMLDGASKERPLTKERYMQYTGLKDSRGMRADINELQLAGYRIVSDCRSKGGYWISTDIKDYLTFRRQEMSRALSILRKISAMDGSLYGQTTINDLILEIEREEKENG